MIVLYGFSSPKLSDVNPITQLVQISIDEPGTQIVPIGDNKIVRIASFSLNLTF